MDPSNILNIIRSEEMGRIRAYKITLEMIGNEKKAEEILLMNGYSTSDIKYAKRKIRNYEQEKKNK
ncbi:hypothetical protein LJC17_01480 [Acholeplasma sp. OttesenSCG-928-E16]|nr:hypothetical protein [Acholeplasma sp. OttesenSCG-928-E16]